MERVLRFLRSAYDGASWLLNWLQSPLLFLIRIFWGPQLVMTGWGKLQHIDKVAQFFAALNLPAPMATAIFVGMVEFIGGILFTLGIGTRLVSLVIFVNMTVAYWTADRDALLGIFSMPDKFYGADPFTFWFSALIILVFGPGVIAVDWFLLRKVKPVRAIQ